MRVALLLVVLAGLPAQAQTASFDLLPPEYDGVHAVSPNGRALVLYDRNGPQTTYAVWLDGAVTPFTPPTCGESYDPLVLAVSNDGVPKGFQRGLAPTSWVWDGQDCRAATGVGGGVVFLSAVTPDGAHAAGDLNIGDPYERGGYLWNDGSGTYLPPPGGDPNRILRLERLSDDGSTAAGYQDGGVAGSYAPILVRNGTTETVPLPSANARVLDLSADGSIAVGFYGGGPTLVGFLYENGVVTEVPPYPGATGCCIDFISGDGARLAGSVQLGSDATVKDAIVWDGLVPRLLRDLLAETGVDPDSIPPNLHVTGLSADGRVLVGRNQDGPSFLSMWRAVLPATAQWADATDGFFDDADRWTPAVVPDSLTAVRFAATGGVHAVTFRRDEAVGSLTVGSATAPLVTFDLGAHTLTVGPDISPLVVGDDESGGLQLVGGGLYVDGSALLGRSGDARGILTLLDGHALAVDGRITVGDEGTGAEGSGILVFGGSVTTTGGMILGAGPGTSGLVSLFSGTSWQNLSEAATSIGFDGEGLLVADAAFVSHTGPVSLGAFEAGRGRIELENASSMLTTDSLHVGLRGAGELLVASGSGLSTGPVVIGDRGGSVGSVRLTGAGSRWDIVGDLVIGDDGAAVLEVVDQAFLCMGGTSNVGPQGSVITDGTIRVEFVAPCAVAAREARQAADAGLLVAGLTIAEGGELVAEALEVGDGGVVDGAGALAVPVANGGTLAPGDDGALGTLALSAALTQRADGVLAVEVGAAAADAVTVAGTATLGGTLWVTALPGEAPTVGQRHEVLTAGSIAGAFDRIEAPDGLAVSVSATAVTVEVVGEVAGEAGPASALALEPPAPNPTAALVALRYALPGPGPVRLAVHDALGREVARLVEAERPAGAHTAHLDASSLAPGVYVVRLRAGAEAVTRTLTVVR